MLTVKSFVTEQTGGGCTALVRYLDCGVVLVLSDGNFGADVRSAGAEPVGLLYASAEDWHGGADPALDVLGTADQVLETLTYWAAIKA